MSIRFSPVLLPSEHGDSEGALVLRDDTLVAVVSRLGDLHGDLFGQWYVETSFLDAALPSGRAFRNLDEVEVYVQTGWPARR